MTAQASSGISSTPPKGAPSPAIAMAVVRLRLNHLLIAVMKGSHIPADIPVMMIA